MGALFGAIGAQAGGPAEAQAIGRTLAHRGAGPLQIFQRHGGWIGLQRDRDHDAIVHSEHRVLALVGLVANIQDTVESDPDLAREGERFLLALDRALGDAPDAAQCVQDWARQLHGAFVLAVLDDEGLHLCRDGAGARTVYYAAERSVARFAIEPKGLWTVPGFTRRLHLPGLARYLAFSFQPGHETLLEGLHELPPGHAALLRPGYSTRLTRWFRFEEVEPEGSLGLPEAAQRFRGLLTRSVEEGLRAQRGEVVATLSGGIDSSVVVAELARQCGGARVHTCAIHFGEQYAHELEHARVVADAFGTDHEELCIQPGGFLESLRKIIWHLDDPIGDPVTMPNFEVAKHLGRRSGIIWNGEGGDPLFGGPKNLSMLMAHWYGGRERPAGWRERAYLASYRRAYETMPSIFSPAVREQFNAQRDLEGVLSPFFQAERPVAFLDKLMAINLRLKGGHLILPKVDRMQGAHGVTPRSPLFDRRMVEFAFGLPGRLKLARGIEKIVMKEAARDWLPSSIIARPKSGMRVPVRFWFQGEMRKYAKHLLSKKAIQRGGLFDPGQVRSLLRYERSDFAGRHGIRLWMLITFEIWRRMVFENETL